MRHSKLLAILITTSLTLGACGGDSGPAESAKSIDALTNAVALIGSFGGQIPNFTNKNVRALLFPKTAAIQNPHRHYGIAAGEMSNALNDYLSGKDVNSALREASERVDKRVAEAMSGAK